MRLTIVPQHQGGKHTENGPDFREKVRPFVQTDQR